MLQARYIDIHSSTVKELRSYIANEGKRLNQQLVEIQKRGLEKTSFGYEALVESNKNKEFLGVSKSGKLKINLNTRGMDRAELQRLAGVINRTVQYKTITPSGIKKYYGSVFASLRDNAGMDGLSKFSDDELADILKTEGWESAKSTLGSEQAFKMIGSADDAEKIKNFLETEGGGKSITDYVKDFNDETGAGYKWEPATNVPTGWGKDKA